MLYPVRSEIGRPILVVSSRGNNRGKGGTQRRNRGLSTRLLAVLEIVVMVMAVMVVAMHDHYNLRLRRIGYREAEEKHYSEQSLFHSLVCRSRNQITELL